MNAPLPNDARVVDAAFRAILDQDWARLDSLQRSYPHLILDPGAAWTITTLEAFRGIRGYVTWSAEETAFVVESSHEPVARWIGYRVAWDLGFVEPIWWGTIQTPAGTWAAQFTTEEGHNA